MSFESVGEEEPPLTLCVEGQPLTEVFVAINGTLDIRVKGVIAATIPPFQLIGEAALLENLQVASLKIC